MSVFVWNWERCSDWLILRLISYNETKCDKNHITYEQNKTKNNDILQMPTTSINFCSSVDFRRFFDLWSTLIFSDAIQLSRDPSKFSHLFFYAVVILLVNVIFQYIWNYLWRGHTLKVLHWHRIVHRSPYHIAFIHLNAIHWT